MKRILFFAKQLLPCTYVSNYRVDGKKFVAVWKMQFGRVFNCKRWEVV